MKSRQRASKPKRPRKRVVTARAAPTAADDEPTSERLHGDSYVDVNAREDELRATTSTHGARSDRRIEEPSERALGEDDSNS